MKKEPQCNLNPFLDLCLVLRPCTVACTQALDCLELNNAVFIQRLCGLSSVWIENARVFPSHFKHNIGGRLMRPRRLALAESHRHQYKEKSAYGAETHNESDIHSPTTTRLNSPPTTTTRLNSPTTTRLISPTTTRLSFSRSGGGRLIWLRILRLRILRSGRRALCRQAPHKPAIEHALT